MESIKKAKKLESYLKRYGIDRGQKGQYKRIADKFGANPEAIRSLYRRLRAKGLVEPENYNPRLLRARKASKGATFWNRTVVPDEKELDFIVEPEESEIPIPLYHEPKNEKILAFADQHFLYHDKEVIKLILDQGKKEEVSTIVLGGDIMDMYTTSRFSKRPDKAKLMKEVEGTKQFLEGLRNMFPKATIFCKQGNHERRLMQYIINSAPALFGLSEIRFENLLGLNDYNIKHVDDKQILKVGKLNILHGHEVPLFPMGINIAKSMLDKINDNVMFFHFHRTNQWLRTDINGDTIGSWAVGASSDLHPDYNTYNQWNHGFAIIDLNSDGTFKVSNRIIDRQLNVY